MAFDIKLFACVARATNSVYFYVSSDTWSTISGISDSKSTYFVGKKITGQLKVGDIILVNSTAVSGGGFGIIRVTSVDNAGGKIGAAKATMGA